MSCDSNRLIAYRDDALDPDARSEVATHLRGCESCRSELGRLGSQASLVSTALEALEPGREAIPDARAALADMDAPALTTGMGRWQRFERSMTNMLRSMNGGRRRAVVATAGIAILLVLVLTVAPARNAAAQFLSYFRVDEFTAVPITQKGVEQLTTFEEVLNSGLLGEPEMVREATPPEPVADIAAAQEMAGFGVREIEGLPESVTLDEMSVAIGPHAKLAMDRAMLEIALDAAGITDVELPELDTLMMEVDIPAVVHQSYTVDDAEMQLIQMPSPELTLPDGVPPTELGEAYLQLLGMPPEEAADFAAGIDWTSTLVIPIPEGSARYRDVTVSGAPGLLLQESYDSATPSLMLLWEDDGVVHSLTSNGKTVSTTMLIRAAESLK